MYEPALALVSLEQFPAAARQSAGCAVLGAARHQAGPRCRQVTDVRRCLLLH
jgi:hypothetical protein